MRAYIDTNVIIDILQEREPYYVYAEKIVLLIADNKMVGYITSSAFTDVYYIIKKCIKNEEKTRKVMAKILSMFEILNTYAFDSKVALDTVLNDYEDGMIEEIAYKNKLDCIVTRNLNDFKGSRVPIYSPKEFYEKLYLASLT